MDISSAERARLQTVEEWLLEYETGKPVIPGTLSKESVFVQRTVMLHYDSHRTTKDGRLVMAFIDIHTGQEVDTFFNVNIKRSRGQHKGKSYRTGAGGQFNVTRGCNFVKFWMNVVGREPSRWCRVHKKMKSNLKGLIFTGELSIKYDKNGSSYTQVKTLKTMDTKQTQSMHKSDTSQAHEVGTVKMTKPFSLNAFRQFKVPDTESTLKP